MKKYCLIKTTFKKKSEAKNILQILFENKLIACAQISTVESIYVWNNNLENEKEFLLSMKTKIGHYNKIERIIIQNHSYYTPQIIMVPIIGGLQKYFNWIESCLLKNC